MEQLQFSPEWYWHDHCSTSHTGQRLWDNSSHYRPSVGSVRLHSEQGTIRGLHYSFPTSHTVTFWVLIQCFLWFSLCIVSDLMGKSKMVSSKASVVSNLFILYWGFILVCFFVSFIFFFFDCSTSSPSSHTLHFLFSSSAISISSPVCSSSSSSTPPPSSYFQHSVLLLLCGFELPVALAKLKA